MSLSPKVIVIGPPTVGKTCLVQRIVNNSFSPDYKVTLGVDFFQKKYVYHQGERLNTLWYHFWDIAGQDYYSKMVHSFYMNAAACLMVCDLSLENIFTDIKQWYEEVSRKVLLNSGKRVPTILVCNKIDLP